MAKETKEDRLVRSMLDQVTEHLHDLKNIEENPNSKEMDVEIWVQSFLKNCLGYTATSHYAIRSQEAKGKMKPDLIVQYKDKPIFVVEVKKITFDLKKSDFRSGKIQLSEYLNQIGNVRWGLLTNGLEWKLFDFSQPEYRGVEVFSFDLKSDADSIETSKKFIEEFCYESLVDFHEVSFSKEHWEECAKEAMAFSPESLARAILSNDVIKYIAKSIRGEHEYKANTEVLIDRVHELVEKGLDDLLAGWNETHQADLQKHIKSQKRASKRTKRAKKSISEAVTVTAETPALSPTLVVEAEKHLTTDSTAELKKIVA